MFNYRAVPATLDEILKGRFSNGTVLPEKVRLLYVASADFKTFARKFGVMDDFRVCLRKFMFWTDNGKKRKVDYKLMIMKNDHL